MSIPHLITVSLTPRTIRAILHLEGSTVSNGVIIARPENHRELLSEFVMSIRGYHGPHENNYGEDQDIDRLRGALKNGTGEVIGFGSRHRR